MENIIREADLLKTGFSFVEAEKIELRSYVTIKGGVSEFLDLCRTHSVNMIFYMYAYYKPEEYRITDEIIKRYVYTEKGRTFCKPWVDSYNRKMKELDFRNPKTLVLCASIDHITVISQMDNIWLDAEKAVDAFDDYFIEHEDEFNELEPDEEPNLIWELQEKLLADKEFRYCTNKDMRISYIDRFLKSKENLRYLAAVKGSKYKWDQRVRFNAIVDQIYQEYRNRCRKLKIPVGDELPEEE